MTFFVQFLPWTHTTVAIARALLVSVASEHRLATQRPVQSVGSNNEYELVGLGRVGRSASSIRDDESLFTRHGIEFRGAL